MKIRLLLTVLALSLAGVAQISDISTPPGGVQLTAACTNANTTCDNAGGNSTVFNPGSSFSVLGPMTIEGQTNGYGLAQITASGTYSGSTLNFEFSDDGGTTWYPEVCARSDINTQESSEAIATNAFRGWECSIGAATKFRVRQSAISTGGPIVKVTFTSGLLEPAPTVAINSAIGTTDPCQNAAVLKSSAKITVASTTAVELVAAVAGKTVYVCGFSATIQGSATSVGTLQLETGTKVTNPCDTSTATLTGVYAGNITANAPTFVESPGGGYTVTQGASGGEVCAVSTGTTIGVGGTLVYVQQ